MAARIAVVGTGSVVEALTEAARTAGHDVLTAQWGETVPIGQVDWLVRACGAHAEAEPMLWRTGQVMDHPGHLLAMADEPPVVHAVFNPQPGPGRRMGVLVPDTHLGTEFASMLPECVVACPQHQMRTAKWRAILLEIAVVPIAVLTHRRDPGVFAVRSVHQLAAGVLREVIDVAEAENVRIPEHEAESIVASLAERPRIASGEIEDWLGMSEPIAELARHHGIPTPLLSTMRTLLAEHAEATST